MSHQPGILLPPPSRGRFLQFRSYLDADPRVALTALSQRIWDDRVVFGIGVPVVRALSAKVKGLRSFPVINEAKVEVPATQMSAWCFLRGDDPGELLHLGREISALLKPGFVVQETIDAFQFKEGRDLSGYVDGTENPSEDDSPAIALLSGGGAGIDGGAFVSVQRWEHNLDYLASWTQKERDHAIGRRHSDNEEIDDAPLTAHVKRTAQESFSPEAFLVRRSMPYSLGEKEGLMFVAYCSTLNAFEAQLKRMVGAEDGVVDRLFGFSIPVTGSHFFCPPVKDGKLDFSALV